MNHTGCVHPTSHVLFLRHLLGVPVALLFWRQQRYGGGEECIMVVV